jgi:hypothetical protein
VAISVVQTVKSNTATTTIAATGTNTLVVCINSFGSSAPSISSVKLGTASLTLAVDKILSSSGEYASWIYYLSGIAAGQTSVVISGTNLGLTSGDGGVSVYEVSGLGAIDKTNSGSSTSGSTYSSGATGTLSQASELVIGTANADTPAAPTGFTTVTDSGDAWISGYEIVSATTSVTFSATGAAPWTACIASFKGLSGTSVALDTATNTIAAYSPGVVAGPIQLATATVSVAAHPVTPSTFTSVALTTATVTVAAHSPGIVAGPIALLAASVTITAPSPGLRVSVALTTAAVTIAAHPLALPRTVALHVASVTVTAHVPSVVITIPRLVASITATSGTDPYGNTYEAGICVYGTSGSFAQLTEGQLQFMGTADQSTPASVVTGGLAGLLEMSSGGVSEGDNEATIVLVSADANEGVSAIDLTSCDQVQVQTLVVGGQAISPGQASPGTAPSSYSQSYLQNLVTALTAAGILS